MAMSQHSVRQAAGAALDAQAVRRKERAERASRLECLALEVLTALGERDGRSEKLSGAPETPYGR
jgi:hypothetical protein